MRIIFRPAVLILLSVPCWFGSAASAAGIASVAVASSAAATPAKVASRPQTSPIELPAETVVQPGAVVPPDTLALLTLIDATHAGHRLVAVGGHGYIIYSDDDGKTWRRADAPYSGLLTAVDFPDPQHGWAVGHGGLILVTTDGGKIWTEQRYKPDQEQPLFGVLFRNDHEGFAVGAYGLLLMTQDGGQHWQQRAIGKNVDRHLNGIVAFGPHQLAIAAESGNLYVSEDDGQNWNDSKPGKGSFFGILHLPDNGLLAYGMLGSAFRSVDGGQNWHVVPGIGPVSLQGGAATVNGLVVLVGSGGTALVSHDAGEHFTAASSGSTRTLATALILDARHVLLFGVHGVSTLRLDAETGKATTPERK